MNGNETEDMKVYRPRQSVGIYSLIMYGVLVITLIVLGYQNFSLRKEIKSPKEQPASKEEVAKEVKESPETMTLNQKNPTENWRIYKNMTYNYKFRVPKTYQARVNNNRNSVEVFNEKGQVKVEISAEPKSDSDSTDKLVNVSIGDISYFVEENPSGNDKIKNPFVVYQTTNDKYIFNLYFYGSVSLDELEKLILATFTPSL